LTGVSLQKFANKTVVLFFNFVVKSTESVFKSTQKAEVNCIFFYKVGTLSADNPKVI
jgi:hypothetical protein